MRGVLGADLAGQGPGKNQVRELELSELSEGRTRPWHACLTSPDYFLTCVSDVFLQSVQFFGKACERWLGWRFYYQGDELIPARDRMPCFAWVILLPVALEVADIKTRYLRHPLGNKLDKSTERTTRARKQPQKDMVI